MHVQVIGAPTESSAALTDVDIGVNALRYVDLDDQSRYDGYAIVPQPKSRLSGNLRLKYLNPVTQVATRHYPMRLGLSARSYSSVFMVLMAHF